MSSATAEIKCRRCGHKKEHHSEGTDIRTGAFWRGCIVNVIEREGVRGCQCKGFETNAANRP